MTVVGVDLIAKEASYNPTCRKIYTRLPIRNTTGVDKETIAAAQSHSDAFEYLTRYVEDSVILGSNVERMSLLKEKYSLYMKVNHPDSYNPDY